MPERDRPGGGVHERDRHRRAHPGGGRVLARALEDAPVRLLDQRGDPLLPAARVRVGLIEHRGGEARRHLARLGAAHPVRDREERRLADVGVLVVAPAPPGVGQD